MSKLIEQFLETHRQCMVQNSVFNISQALDQEALAIYEQAQAEAHRRSKGKPDDTARQRKLLNSALETQLTRVLDKVDLLNKAHHDTLRNSIQRWCPWQKGKQQACLQVQKVLLTLLPVAQQKQQLGALCQEYKAHLKNAIEEQVKNNYDYAYITCSTSRTILFGAAPVADRPQIRLVTDRRSPVERLAGEPSRYLQNPDKPLALALQKYQTVSQLEATLATPVKSATEQVKDFNQVFKAQRSVLEKDRDSLAIKFLKGVATVLSLGIAWGLGIWGIKGKVTTEKVQQVLETPRITPSRVNSH